MALPYGERNNVSPCCEIPGMTCPPPYRFLDVPPDERRTLDFYEVFLRGKPKLIGILQMALGIFHIGLGISFSSVFPGCYSSYIGNNIWGPLCFLATGSVSYYAGAKRSFQFIKFALTMNISNIFLSCVGIALNSLDVTRNEFSSCFKYRGTDRGVVSVSFIIFTNVIQIFLTITVLVSGFQSMRCSETGTPQVYVIPNNAPSLLPPPYSADPSIFTEESPNYSNNMNERG